MLLSQQVPAVQLALSQNPALPPDIAKFVHPATKVAGTCFSMDVKGKDPAKDGGYEVFCRVISDIIEKILWSKCRFFIRGS
jgi:hypothetical protein